MSAGFDTIALTLLALIAFASNSILTRMGLASGEIDAASFTSVRLASGAIVLASIVRSRTGAWTAGARRGFVGPIALFVYAAPFSFAYLRIGAAVGALVLFGVVQVTMIGAGIARGERLDARTVAGFGLAAAGFCVLTVPAASRPDPVGVGLMAVAGVAWGIYSLAGKRAADPLAENARSFLWCVPLAALLSAIQHRSAFASPRGLVLAGISGAITSGLGYAIWYRALRGLRATQAAIVQLAVPVIAAFAAVLVLSESLSARLCVAGASVLGGIALVLSRPKPSPPAPLTRLATAEAATKQGGGQH